MTHSRQLTRGPYRYGDRAYLSSYPIDYTPNLLQPPQAFRTGTVQMSGPHITWIRFDDGEQITVKTKALNKGEPVK